MQKQYARPCSQYSNEYQSNYQNQQQILNISSLNLNQRRVSIAQTIDQNILLTDQKQPKHTFKKNNCQQFLNNHHQYKTKCIQKKVYHHFNHHNNIDKYLKPQRKKHNYQKKVQSLQNQIKQLQKQIHSLRRNKQFQSCPNCNHNFKQYFQRRSLKDIIIPQERYCPANDSIQAAKHEIINDTKLDMNNKDTVQFQQFNFMTPLMMTKQMQEKSWIFLGTIMIAMGSKIIDMDGTINVFKILNQSIDQLRRQVQKSQTHINMDFFMTKEEFLVGNRQPNSFAYNQSFNDQAMGMNFDPFFNKIQQHPAGFQLQGIKLQSVESYELFYDQKIKFSVKYQALLTVIQYLREHCKIQ